MPQPYQDEREFEHPYEEVFEAVPRAIGRFPKMVLLATDAARGRIVVMQGMNLRTFMATIVIDVGPVSARRTRVRVWSAIANLYDLFNKNRSNVNQILAALDEELNPTSGKSRIPGDAL